MKKLLLLWLCLIVLGKAVYSQSPSNSQIGLYLFNQSILMTPSKSDGTSLYNSPDSLILSISSPRQKFRVLKLDNSKSIAIIQILDYTKNSKPQGSSERKIRPIGAFYQYNFLGTSDDYNNIGDNNANARNYGKFQRYFTIPIDYLADPTISEREDRVKGSLAAGVINFPFKYRPQKGLGDFAGAFNFGAGIGYTFPHKSWRQFTYSIISGYSVSSVILDSSNTNKNQDKLSSTNNFAAFSFSLGIVAQYQQVQAGIFLGWDRLSRQNQIEYGWKYQGKPWISAGFGFAIFSTQKATASPADTNSD